MKKYQQSTHVAIFVIILQCMFMTNARVVMAEELPAWQIFALVEYSANKKQMRGQVLHTTNQEIAGAAFQCLNRDLYTYLAPNPFDFGQLSQQNFRRRNRDVSFSINGGSQVEEHWGVKYSGNLYSVQEESTRLDMFRAAISGATIAITPKDGELVTISLPPIDSTTIGTFIEQCNLKTQFLPLAVEN